MTHKEKKNHNTYIHFFFSSPSFCLTIMELHLGTPEVQPVVEKKVVPTIHAVVFLSLIYKMKHENFLINKCEIMGSINTKLKCDALNII